MSILGSFLTGIGSVSVVLGAISPSQHAVPRWRGARAPTPPVGKRKAKRLRTAIQKIVDIEGPNAAVEGDAIDFLPRAMDGTRCQAVRLDKKRRTSETAQALFAVQ